MVELSVTIPCYNSSASLQVLIGRLTAILSNSLIDFEIILVNDASTNNTWEIIRSMANNNPKVVGINLAQNVGQEIATLCGLAHSNGRFCVTMDDDLQHSPEGVLMLYNSITKRQDIDVIIASFPNKQHNIIRNFFTRVQKLIRNSSFKDAKNIDFTSFRILRKEIVEKIVALNVGFPKIGLLSLMITKKIVNVSIEHFKRPEGKSTYSFSKLMRSFLNSLFYYSVPIKRKQSFSPANYSVKEIIGVVFNAHNL